MKMRSKILLISIVLGIVHWIMDAKINFFAQGYSGVIWDELLFDLSYSDFFMRLWVIVSFLLFGAIVAAYMKKQRESERKTETAYAELRQIFDSAAGGMCVVDTDFNVLRVNRRFEELFDIRKGAITGRKCHKLIHNNHCGTESCPMRRILAGEPRVEYEEKRRRDGGRSCWHVAATPLKTPEGEIIGIIENFRDITDSKLAEFERERLVGEMAGKNVELEDFAYIVSHDLKAPLRAIGTLSEWIETDYSDRLDDDGREQLGLLRQRVKRMHDLIEGVLAYSRAGRVREEMTRVDLNDLVPEIIDMIAPPDTIAIRIETPLPVIVAERTRIGQVFENLLSNAVKFMDKPDGRISISCADEGGSWRFSVSDNGPGIEERHFERIFKIFQTLSSRDDFESTGVGLSLVRKIVTMYRGTVDVESTVGEGTTFHITLPKKEKEAHEESFHEYCAANHAG